MSLVQRFFAAIFPASWAEDMRRESESWRIRCLTCGESRSVWEAGGIRWKARSVGKRCLIRCPRCGGFRLASVERVDAP